MHQIDMYYVIGKRTLLIHKDNDHHIVHNSRKFSDMLFYLFNDSTT